MGHLKLGALVVRLVRQALKFLINLTLADLLDLKL